MKKTANHRLTVRRERIRTLTDLETRGVAAGTESLACPTSSTIPLSRLLHCLPVMTAD